MIGRLVAAGMGGAVMRRLAQTSTTAFLVLSCLLPPPAAAGGGLRIYADEMHTVPGGRVTYGHDRNAVCLRGFCSNGTTVCLRNATCAGIGDGQCHYTACSSDFNLCDDGTTLCAAASDCTGIGDGSCNDNPCEPPNEMCGVMVSSLTPGAPTEQTIWQLVCNPATPPAGSDCQVGAALPPTTVSWDFSDFNPTNLPDLAPTSSTTSPIAAAEFAPGSSNAGDCGFAWGGGFPARKIDREDANFTDPANVVPTLTSTERQDDVRVCADGRICVTSSPDCNGIGDGVCRSTSTFWLRGIVRFDGIEGAAIGEGESRLCHADDDGTNRTEVPLWRFPNEDALGYYMQLGDPVWQHTPFACEQAILAPSALARIDASPPSFAGTQSAQVVNEGLVELPSGHRFRALVTRSVTEYDVALSFAGTCNIDVDDVRTVLYLWEVPHVGTVVRLQSNKVAPDTRLCDDATTVCTSNANCTGIGSGICNVTTPGEFLVRHLSEVDVKHGLFPPLTLHVGPLTDDTIDVSWDPGAITSHIDGFRVWWGEESGGSCSLGGEDCNADHPGAGFCAAGRVCCATPGAVCQGYERDSLSDPGLVTFDAGCALAPGDTRCATIGGLDPATTYHVTVTARSSYTHPVSGAVTQYESALYPARIPAVPVDLPLEVSATTTGGAAAAGAVPDGDDRPGVPLSVSRSGTDVVLSWGASCRPGDTTYAVYEGPLGAVAGHTPVTCDSGGATSWGPFAPDAGDRFFLVVPRNVAVEGSYGLDSAGAERPPSGAACVPQQLAVPVCP
jgi:hypothetical protein